MPDPTLIKAGEEVGKLLGDQVTGIKQDIAEVKAARHKQKITATNRQQAASIRDKRMVARGTRTNQRAAIEDALRAHKEQEELDAFLRTLPLDQRQQVKDALHDQKVEARRLEREAQEARQAKHDRLVEWILAIPLLALVGVLIYSLVKIFIWLSINGRT